MLRQLQLFALQRRLRHLDTALDRLQVRYASARHIGGDLAAQRVRHRFDNLAIDRAMLAHRVQRVAERARLHAAVPQIRALAGRHGIGSVL